MSDIFTKTGIEDQVQGECLFKQTIEVLMSQPYNSKSRRWARRDMNVKTDLGPQIKGDRSGMLSLYKVTIPHLFCICNAHMIVIIHYVSL